MKSIRLPATLVALGVAAALLATFAWPAGAAAPDESRGLTVSGVGVVRVAPDVAEWSFGVQTEAATAREALRKNAQEIAAVIAALKAAGIAPQDIRTQQVSLFPRTSPEGTQVVGYTASNTVSAVVREIAKAGVIVDAAAEAGANQIFGPTLTVSSSDALYEQALDRAYDQAVVKAKRLAAKAGVSLGQPVSIVEGSVSGPLQPFIAKAEAAGGDTPIETGLTEIQASVSVTFAIS
jgi:uncharacterized protein YggE